MRKAMTRPDLHMHSTYSDGACTPRQLVEMAVQAGVTVMAVTDHDAFDGADLLRNEQLPLTVIPGVELSLSDLPHLHLLGYGLGNAPLLRGKVRELAENRLTRSERMLERLAAHGMPLDAAKIRASAQGSVGRPHIAAAMVEAGYVRNIQEAFALYIGDDCPCYVASERMNMAQALMLMRDEGFVPVLAHPMCLELEEQHLQSLLTKWQHKGLLGMEVYHPSAGGAYAALDRMARRRGLLVTGGSDFHRANDNHGLIGSSAALWRQAQADVEALQLAMQS